MAHDESELSIPPESTLLRTAYERSGLAVPATAEATDISKASIHIAMNGFRYRKGEPVVVSPPDKTVVKLASLLRVEPQAIRDAGRERAAQLLEEIPSDQRPTSTLSDYGAQSQSTGRQILARQMLGVFPTEELRAEIERREAKLADNELYSDDQGDEEADDNEAFHRELSEDLHTQQWPE